MKMEYMNALENFRDSLTNEIAALQEQARRCDLGVQDFLHYVEFGDYTEVESIQIVRNLKRLRDERRTVKNKLEALHDIRRHIKQAEQTGYEPRKRCYSYRVLNPGTIKAGGFTWEI